MLTVSGIHGLAVTGQRYRRYDAGGLYLEVQPSGSKLWRWKYRWQGKARVLALGAFPAVGLADAREARDEARKRLRAGHDPSVTMRRRVVAQAVPEPTSTAPTLRAVAERWWRYQEGARGWSPKYTEDVRASLDRHVLSVIGDRPVDAITPLDLLDVLRPLLAQGRLRETVRRTRQRLSEVFRMAVLEGLRTDDPAAVLQGSFPAPVVESYRTIREHEIAPMLADVAQQGNPLATALLRLQLLTATRPTEARAAVWAEFDIERAEWHIPAERMKRARPHIAPLSRQALKVLADLRTMTGHRVHLFPGHVNPRQPVSDALLRVVLERAGWGDRLTPHGLRSLFQTICEEHDLAAGDVIEHALAHVERSKTTRAYDRSTRLLARRTLMQRWADHLDALAKKARTRKGPSGRAA